METEGYGSTYENVSIIGGVITTGVSVGGGSGNASTGATFQNGAASPTAGRNGAALLPKSSSMEGVAGLAKKPVPKPRRISLLTTAEMTHGQGTTQIAAPPSPASDSATTTTATAKTTTALSKPVADKDDENSPGTSPKRSPENVVLGKSTSGFRIWGGGGGEGEGGGCGTRWELALIADVRD